MEANSAAMEGGSVSGAGDHEDRVSDSVTSAVETVRAKTATLQAGLADLLDSSARVIRSRGLAAADASGSAMGDGAAERLAQSGEATAAVLEQGATWLRENDLSEVEARVTAQLKEHPARTLLVAAGIGFLLSRRR